MIEVAPSEDLCIACQLVLEHAHQWPEGYETELLPGGNQRVRLYGPEGVRLGDVIIEITRYPDGDDTNFTYEAP